MDRNAVYWGVAPYPEGHEGFAPYSEWTQAHARDLGEKDFSAILKEAREWLRAPVLSKSIEGIERDTQLRAALDLSIRTYDDGRYSVGLHPQQYNQLLARLAGKSEEETLITVRGANTHDSVYVAAGEKPMSASVEIRKFASTVATSNPDVAYDLVSLADRLAQDEQQQSQQSQEQKQAGEVPPQFKEHMKEKKEEGQGQQDQGQEQQKQASSYRTLKAAILNTAKANPAIRNALLPVLQTIKQLG